MSKKKKSKKNSNGKVIIICILIFLIGCGVTLVSFGLTHDIFNIKKFEISGNDIISNEEIIERSKVVGENIFLVKENNIEKNLKKKDILKIQVSKKLPDTLVINLTENKDIAYILDENKNKYYVNALGEVSENKITSNEDLPLIRGINIELVKNKGNIFDDKNIKLIFDTIENTNIIIEEYDFTKKNKIIIKSEEITVIIGDLKDLDEKMGIIEKLLSDISINSTDISKIDISDVDNPIVVER